MSRTAWIRCLVLAAACPLSLPAAATALPLQLPAGTPPQLRVLVRSRVQPPAGSAEPFQSQLELETHSGYRVEVIGAGDRAIVLVARKGSHALTAYVARGTVTPGRIDASFGDLGRVAVRFRPSGRISRSTVGRGCREQNRSIARLGVFVGKIRLAGEDDYLSVHAHRARGKIRRPIALRCPSGHLAPPGKREGNANGGHPADLPISFLSASWRQGVASASFATLGIGDRASLFIALTEQSEGALAILRFAVSTRIGKGFTADDALTRARVTPLAPFHGSGTYRAAPDGTKTWTGDLSVNFPGAPRLPLSGPRFKATLDASF